ncbi:MAG: hypothetical protein IT372_27315 [Polyangiaceae bacterium]|nr:hypothetical protein [Polyangiaceae bacterium]
MRLTFTIALAAAALTAGAGCIDTDAAVFVEPAISGPSAAVTGGTLGTQLTGGFRLELHLGPRASGASQVSIRSFEITDAAQTAAIVSPLEAVTATALPVTVETDSDVAVEFTFDTGADLLPAEARDPLCAAEGIRITGSIQDSLQDGATPVASAVFQATCM